jgi:hypothetical protein
MAKTLITIGIILVVIGLCWPLLQKLNLGRLPGDFVFKSGNFSALLQNFCHKKQES